MKNPLLTADIANPLRVRHPELFGVRFAISQSISRRRSHSDRALSYRHIERLVVRNGRLK